MKTLLTFSCLLGLSMGAYCQKVILPVKDSAILYEEVVSTADTAVTADKLYDLAQIWFANYFVNTKSTILVSNRHSQKIIGTGIVFYNQRFNSVPPVYLHYTIAIDVRKGKYRYQVYDVFFQKGQSQLNVSEQYMRYVHNDIVQVFLESKKNAMSRYETKFNFVNKKVSESILSLKTQMSDLTADNF